MQITATMQDAMNSQMTEEFQAGYSYYAMAGWLDRAGFPGMAGWMRAQADEEWMHAKKFGMHITDRGGGVSPGPLAAPKAEFESVAEVFTVGLAQERTVSTLINELYSLALDQRDHASIPLLDWFVAEQIEEEANFGQIVADLELAADDSRALLMLDRELGARPAVVQ